MHSTPDSRCKNLEVRRFSPRRFVFPHANGGPRIPCPGVLTCVNSYCVGETTAGVSLVSSLYTCDTGGNAEPTFAFCQHPFPILPALAQRSAGCGMYYPALPISLLILLLLLLLLELLITSIVIIIIIIIVIYIYVYVCMCIYIYIYINTYIFMYILKMICQSAPNIETGMHSTHG